jgi:uncharacterized FlaG/YvyC family protein
MTKFDQLISELTTPAVNTANPAANNNQTNNQQTNTANNQQQATQPSKPVTPNNTQKPNLEQLMKDFNDPNKKINNLNDLVTNLKNYGINVEQK